ncbi:MAG TPA: hypothetical protein VJT12_06700, partial [Methyloceanibacter sp.]|nr:hypothetical protein [Methyloceanibacter sp.]
MGSFNHPRVYDPLDLEVLEHVYEAAWARVEANDFDRDRSRDDELQEALRKWVFALSHGHPVNFDELMARLDGVT